ncbi:MAG: PEGA domain-containing protein [Pirellulales bacterium]
MIAAALLALVLPAGCVRRRLNVRSNPPGALVFVDNQQIGTTPCSVDFTYYGTREIRLVKPGYETLTVNQPIPTPWYQIPPIDFVSDNLLPNQIEDHRTVAFNLEPQIVVPTEQLIERGNQLRQETLAGVGAPPAVVVPGPLAGSMPVVAPGATLAPTLAPPDTFAPTPSLAPPPSSPPSAQPVTLPPVNQAPAVQQPFAPPPSTPSPYGQSLPSTTVAPGTLAPATLAPGTTIPTTVPPTALPPTTLPPTTTTPAPFSAPALPPTPSAGSQQQGPPIVSPPLR